MSEVLVAGGGPAGATAAAVLARAGHDVTVLERTTGPAEKVCGEFVSGEALLVLARAGVDIEALGGPPIGAVRLVRGGGCVEARLPFAARGLSRGRLDEALLDHAARSGAQIERGRTIVRAEPGPDATTLVLADGERRMAATVFLATGKHDVRGARRAAPAGELVGFKTHLRLAATQARALAGHVEIIIFRHAYVGLQCIEGGRATLCLLVRQSWLRACGGYDALLEALMQQSPHLRGRLRGAEMLFARPLTIAGVPYGFVHAPSEAAVGDTGVFRLGDQAAVIPSFVGDGMAMALHSAALAARMFTQGHDAAAYHRQFRRDIRAQVGRAWALYRLGATPAGQAGLFVTARACPPLLRVAASLTRVPPRALRGPAATPAKTPW